MLNQTIIVGRLVKNPEIKELESGKKVSIITLAVPRSFKNINGEYESDFIDCILWDSIASNTTEYCRKGDLVGVKGRLQKGSEDNELKIIAEKVTFLQSKKGEDE